ncbi:ribonuclease H-like domain-containing protein [Lentinula edodes]|uniref:ribonuclease H-like domain-containing protein n=1 Tax=Lentinula edodes TaxID=5353 RepID=UPI001E8D431F|nr:ribonuclease H-like domain-containing protein [Lentinula edodes]KAH7877021.1 ribonuclease H-like domain-containing protein [Lentinula edodes]
MSSPGESIDALLKARKHYIDNPEALMPEFLDVVNQNTLAGSTERNLWMCHVDELTEAIKENKELPEIQGRNHSTKRPVDDDLILLGESESEKVGLKSSRIGRKPDDLMAKLVTKSKNEVGKELYACIACQESWMGKPTKKRVFPYSSTCAKMLSEHKDLASAAAMAAGNLSLGAEIDKATKDSLQQETSEPVSKQHRIQKKLDVTQYRVAGKKATEKETELFNKRLGLLQLKLVTVCGVAPHVFDMDVWKELATLSNPRWSPYTGDQIQVAIKLEAELCRQKTVEAVSKEVHNTITFDGTSLRRNQSAYTVHVSTPDRKEYFLHAHKGDKARHTAPWVRDRLIESVELIGPDTVAATCSDSTSVTKLAKELLVCAYPHILDLRDAVHHLHNTIGDITKLEYFTPTMKLLKSTVAHFSKSNLSVASLKEQASLDGDDYRAIQKSGNTRFGSNWTMATSAKDIEFKSKSVQAMFKHELNGKLTMFKLTLGHYEAIVAPFIRSLWSLEAPKANASDVYVFWLLSAAAVTDLFKKSSNITGIPRHLKEQVNGIFNARFAEFFSNDLYFTAFILDNRYDEAEFFVDAAKIRIIPRRSEVLSISDTATALPRPQIRNVSAFCRVCHFLLCLLKPELQRALKKRSGSNAPFILDVFPWDMDGKEVVSTFEREFEAFWRKEFPFSDEKSSRNKDPLIYWRGLAQIKFARVIGYLAVKIFSITINSMADERTNSMITWFNSPYRGRQTSQTVESMVMVGQWYRRHDEASKVVPAPRKHPVVKFSNLDKTYLKKLQFEPHPTRNLGDSSDESEDNEEDEEEQSEGEKEAQMPKKRGRKKRVISSASCIVVDENEINLASPALLAMISDELQTLCDTPESAMASGSSQLLVSEEVNRRDVPVNWESLGI